MMQSIGDILNSARTEKGYSIDQVAHDTNISRNYIEYLENEDFEQFPAEAYLIGFLRNYSDYLGLEAEKLITLYKNHKISEEPTPIEELVGKKKSSIQPLIYILVVGAVGLVAFLGIKIFPRIQSNIQENRQLQLEEENRRDNRIFPVEEDIQEIKILEGDTIIFSRGDLSFSFLVKNSGDHILLTQEDNSMGDLSESILRLNEEVYLSLFSDSPDYRLFLQDMGLNTGESLLIIEALAQQEEMERAEDDVPTMSELETELAPQTGNREIEAEVILTLPSAERFTLDIRFRGYSLYRYELDGRDRAERYYRDGDNFRLDVNRSVVLWLSNGGAAYAKVNGEEINLGSPGEVVVKKIQWVRNDQGSYDLVLLPVY